MVIVPQFEISTTRISDEQNVNKAALTNIATTNSEDFCS